MVARVWFSGAILSPSFASTASCRPSDQRRPGIMRPVNSSTMMTWGRSDAAPVVHRLQVLDHVVHVLVEDVVGLEGLVDVVGDLDVGRVGEVLDAEQPLAVGAPCSVSETVRDFSSTMKSPSAVSSISESLPSTMVAARLSLRDDPVDLLVHRGPALRAPVAPRDDQRGARLVDQDRVDLVHDRVVVLALDHLVEAEPHVVAEVVEAELVVRAVGDVGRVGLAAACTGRRAASRMSGETNVGVVAGTASRAGSPRRSGRARGRSAPSTGRRGGPGSR